MRIAMLQDDWWPQVGGGPIAVRELSKALATECGHTVDIYTRALKEGELTYKEQETYANDKVTVYRRPPATEYHNLVGRAASLFTLIPWEQLGQYDIIHGHAYLPGIPTWLSGHLGRVPTVFTVHGTALPSNARPTTSPIRNWVERHLERALLLTLNYGHVISVNKEHLKLLMGHHNQVSHVPNGVDVDRFDIDRNPQSGRILYLGRLSGEKRIDTLIRALPSIQDEFPNAELVLVGTGPEREHLERLVRELNITPSVNFVGRVPEEETPKYYASAELYVLPSIWEGHPLTLLEAWATGTPVIASDTEGISEFVDDGETGFLVEPKSPRLLAEAITYALTHSDETAQWAKNAKQLVESEYTWSATAQRTEHIYQDVLDNDR